MIQDQVFNQLLNSLRDREKLGMEALVSKAFESRYEVGQLQGKIQGLREAQMILMDLLEVSDN